MAFGPRRLAGPPPVYPSRLRQQGVTGRVIVSFVVDTAGRVEPASVSVISATERDFVDPTLEAVRGSRFSPGLLAGCPVRVRIVQPVNYCLGACLEPQ